MPVWSYGPEWRPELEKSDSTLTEQDRRAEYLYYVAQADYWWKVAVQRREAAEEARRMQSNAERRHRDFVERALGMVQMDLFAPPPR